MVVTTQVFLQCGAGERPDFWLRTGNLWALCLGRSDAAARGRDGGRCARIEEGAAHHPAPAPGAEAQAWGARGSLRAQHEGLILLEATSRPPCAAGATEGGRPRRDTSGPEEEGGSGARAPAGVWGVSDPSVPPTGPSKLRLQAGKIWRFWRAETPISQKRRP